MLKLYFATLSISFSSSNLCSVYILSNISYNIINNFSIHLFILQYKSFLVIDFITKLKKILLILCLVISDFVK